MSASTLPGLAEVLLCCGLVALAGCAGAAVGPGEADAGGGEPQEDCSDLMDNDGDLAVDCDDIDCARASVCQQASRSETDCTNGIDDDGDNRTDCTDSDCDQHPQCQGSREICGDGRDNDQDGRKDCSDLDCAADPSCLDDPEPEVCTDSIDNDRDGIADCGDPDCADHPSCRQVDPEVCDDRRDNDLDGDTDCQDADCARDPACAEPDPEVCNDGVDNDLDGAIDCRDRDCEGHPACQGEPDPERCDDGRDNDGDGRVDCDDPDCARDIACREICDDGRDNDGDGRVDCDDTDCARDIACQEICDDGRDNDSDGDIDCLDQDCARDPACEAQTPEVCNDRQDNDGDGRVDCEDSDCDGDPACRQPEDEDCEDGVDNDGDRASDCADDDCFNHASCRQGSCDQPYPTSFGQSDGDNSALRSEHHGSCGILDGREAVHSLAVDRSGLVCLETFGSTYDTVLYVRESCSQDLTEIGCNDDADDGFQSQLELQLQGGTTYSVFVDAFDMSDEGHYVLDIRRGGCGEADVEICDDRVDNDGDGETDCADPDCAQDPICDGPPLADCDDPMVVDAEGTYIGDSSDLANSNQGSCGGDSGPEAVVALQVPFGTAVCADTAGSSFDTVLYVREALCVVGTELACNDDAIGLQSQIEFVASALMTYFIFADAYDGDGGQFALNITFGPCDG